MLNKNDNLAMLSIENGNNNDSLDSLHYSDEEIEKEYEWRLGIFENRLGIPHQEAENMARVLTNSWKKNVLGMR